MRRPAANSILVSSISTTGRVIYNLSGIDHASQPSTDSDAVPDFPGWDKGRRATDPRHQEGQGLGPREQGSVQKSCHSFQFAFQCCKLTQLLNTQKNVLFHLNLH